MDAAVALPVGEGLEVSLDAELDRIAARLRRGELIPYVGPEALLLDSGNHALPVQPEVLVDRLVKRVAVPARIRRNLTAAAQYIENFRHRKVLRRIMQEAFAEHAVPTRLHTLLGALGLPMIVDTGYDDAFAQVLQAPGSFGQVQGVSRADVKGEQWVAYYDGEGQACDAAQAAEWRTLLYKPLGGVRPAANFLISDSDFVEVLSEIDIQTPIPDAVQARRAGRSFLFLGCRFQDQLARTYARQVIKRSGGGHVAILPAALTRNEGRFLADHDIGALAMPLGEFVDRLSERLCDGISGAA